MNTTRKGATIVGALFIIAIVTSIAGGLLIESVLTTPDYLAEVAMHESLVVMGVLLELINGIAVIVIAAMLFPILKQQNEAMALSYVGFRLIEAAIIVAGVVTPLMLIVLSRTYVAAAPAADAASYSTIGSAFVAARERLIGQLMGIFFSLGALLLYALLYQTKVVPRFISLWGLAAVVLVFAWNLLELFGIHVEAGMVFGLPIILNELFLGIWLIVKGFDPRAAVFGAAEAERYEGLAVETR